MHENKYLSQEFLTCKFSGSVIVSLKEQSYKDHCYRKRKGITEDIVLYAPQKSLPKILWKDFYLVSVKGLGDPSPRHC